MAIENATRPRRSSQLNPTPCRDAPNEIERSNISKYQPADGPVASADGAPLQTLLDAVEDQRINLVNVLGIVHSMGAILTEGAEDSAPEIPAAFGLLEQEIQRVVAGLKDVSLTPTSLSMARTIGSGISTASAQNAGERGTSIPWQRNSRLPVQLS